MRLSSRCARRGPVGLAPGPGHPRVHPAHPVRVPNAVRRRLAEVRPALTGPPRRFLSEARTRAATRSASRRRPSAPSRPPDQVEDQLHCDAAEDDHNRAEDDLPLLRVDEAAALANIAELVHLAPDHRPAAVKKPRTSPTSPSSSDLLRTVARPLPRSCEPESGPGRVREVSHSASSSACERWGVPGAPRQVRPRCSQRRGFPSTSAGSRSERGLR